MGTGLVWTGAAEGAGALLRLHGCRGVIVESLGFSPAARPGEAGGPARMDTAIELSDDPGGGAGDLWLEDLHGGWRGGVQEAAGQGFAGTFLRVRDVAGAVTVRRTAAHNAKDQGLELLRSPQVHLELYAAGASRRAVRAEGGALLWAGGGGGNGAAQYLDPVVLELGAMTGPVLLLGREAQDERPGRALRVQGAAEIYFVGDHQYLPAPTVGRLIEAPEASLCFLGCGLGWPEDKAPITVTAAEIVALGVIYPHPGEARPWQAAVVNDLGSQGEALGRPWPETVAALPEVWAMTGEALRQAGHDYYCTATYVW